MKRAIWILATLLAVQVLLALVLYYTSPGLSTSAANTPLLATDISKIDRLTIEGEGNDRAVMAKVNGTWQLPDEFNFPADARKITQFLDTLKSIKLGTPVATSAGAIDRFKVAEKNFERRITLGRGNKTVAILYLGTPQGMREMHARRDDQKAVFAIRLASYDAPAKNDAWEDKDVLQMPKAEITGINAAGLLLKPTPATKDNKKATKPDWQAEGLKAGETLKPEAADKLAELLANLRIGNVLGRTNKTTYGLDKPVLTLTLTKKDGKHINYHIGKMSDGSAYVLKSSARDEYFSLPTFSAEPLIDAAKRETLLGRPPTDTMPHP